MTRVFVCLSECVAVVNAKRESEKRRKKGSGCHVRTSTAAAASGVGLQSLRSSILQQISQGHMQLQLRDASVSRLKANGLPCSLSPSFPLSRTRARVPCRCGTRVANNNSNSSRDSGSRRLMSLTTQVVPSSISFSLSLSHSLSSGKRV